MSVSGLTLTSALRHWNIRPSVAINQGVASSARRGLTLRSWKSASCLRRKRFSAAREVWEERIAREASLTRSKATNDEVRRQRVMLDRTRDATGGRARAAARKWRRCIGSIVTQLPKITAARVGEYYLRFLRFGLVGGGIGS